VQKELELERAAVTALINTDPFLVRHCETVLFEKEAAPSRPRKQPYLECLGSCQVYVLIIDVEYGRPDGGDLSATHNEYRMAQERAMPTIILVKGQNLKDAAREPKTRSFLDEIKSAGHTYRRFHDREDLKPELRAALLRLLKEDYHLVPSSDEASDGEHQMEAASAFESVIIEDSKVSALDAALLAEFVEVAIERPGMRIWDDAPEHALVSKGLAIPRPKQGAFVTRAAFLLFAPKPAHRFPQCEILADAYDESRISGKPKGQETINAPILNAVEVALKFVDDHTFHPRRVVGLNNIRLSEYPERALREALINAVAHRSYDDSSRKIILRIFKDRLEIASPGYPLKPLTVAKLRRGNYRPCSRNPLIAQTLAALGKMEQRGSGFARMHDAMLDHGLEVPEYDQQDGYFVVTFRGPDGDYDRLRVSAEAAVLITPAIEARLNERQKKMATILATGEELTSRRCEKEFGVTRDTTARDFALLLELGLAVKLGKGRSVRYGQPTSR
jgi:ATP-dependent DNA helicase RecG